ncbi:MAG: CDP-glycerol glycerophosphotransferase family protein [Acetatifactor sp.]|nr:CDP-glycerol glycerophosphotransferase family protein [Acetatifactor sp.]
MIVNVALKRFLINNIFPIFTLANKMIPKQKNTIFIYCANGELNDNSEALFEYLVENRYYKEYRIVCGVKSPQMYKDMKRENIKFIPLMLCGVQYMISGRVFYSMGKIPIKPSKNQCVINMWHGTAFKKIGLLSNKNNGTEFFFNYVCATSELYSPIMAQAFGCPIENVCICGEPKTDKLFLPKQENVKEKMVVWAPTYRQSKFLGDYDSSEENLLPLFKNSEWGQLNEHLRKCKIKLIVKLHPMQDLQGFTYEKQSNLIIYSDGQFKKEKLNLYEVLSQSDALITDYSSVSIEYLMVDRPICYAFGDYNEYMNTRGFFFDNPLEYMPGEKVVNKEELYHFFKSIADGNDSYQKQRKLVNQKVNYYNDGKNCERVLAISGITPKDGTYG